jgi:hypothetical protein
LFVETFVESFDPAMESLDLHLVQCHVNREAHSVDQPDDEGANRFQARSAHNFYDLRCIRRRYCSTAAAAPVVKLKLATALADAPLIANELLAGSRSKTPALAAAPGALSAPGDPEVSKLAAEAAAPVSAIPAMSCTPALEAETPKKPMPPAGGTAAADALAPVMPTAALGATTAALAEAPEAESVPGEPVVSNVPDEADAPEAAIAPALGTSRSK